MPTCNVTVSGCTFDVPGAVGIKSYTGGDKNLTVTDCTATANAHSLIQAKGIDGILIENCTLKSACDDGDAVVVLRGTADYATLTIENTTLDGTIQITNTATGATVVQ